MDKISVLIVDDHTLFRKGVRKMLEAEEDMKVMGEAATGREALEQARALMPDVILMDIKMPDLDGIEATRTLHREMPHVGIIFVTMFQDDEFVFQGLKAGGRGYILKDADPETMLRAIRAVAHGESLLGPTIAQKALRQFSALPKVPQQLYAPVAYVTAPIPVGPSSWGIRLIFPVVEGTVKGPKLNGKFRPFGADWELIRADNCFELDVHAVIETDDGGWYPNKDSRRRSARRR
jgi:DNA-binding NarL/FixJ family response regulator